VLLPLLGRGLLDARHRLTARGGAARAARMARLGIRLRWRAGAALSAELVSSSPAPDLRAAFAAIDRGVVHAWSRLHGD